MTVVEQPDSEANFPPRPGERPQREVRFEYTPHFPQILEHVGASLLVSTYQAGKLGVIGTHRGRLTFSFLNYTKAMGVAIGPRQIAVGSARDIHFLRPAPALAPSIEPAGVHDGCWLTRGSHHTGNIHVHELAWGGEGRGSRDEGRGSRDPDFDETGTATGTRGPRLSTLDQKRCGWSTRCSRASVHFTTSTVSYPAGGRPLSRN